MNRNMFWPLLFACAMRSFSLAQAAEALPALPPLPPLPVATSSPSDIAPVPLAPVRFPKIRGGSFDLRFIALGQLVDLLYGEALKVPHVISSEVLQDQRVVSFQYSGRPDELRSFAKVFLERMGFAVETADGVDFVSKRNTSTHAEDRETLVYRPRFRTASYLSNVVSSVYGGHVLATSTPVSPPAGASGVEADSTGATAATLVNKQAGAMPAGEVDQVVFVGPPRDVVQARKLLTQLDVAAGEVVVRGWVFEVADTSSTNSAFSIAAKVLGGSLSLSNGSADSDGTALRFSGGWLNVAISALSADSRFRQVSDPHVRVVSGERVRLNVGSQVPTLGSISYQGASGTPVQSVQYQDAGLIFDVQPTVLGDVVQLKLVEQISSFVATTTGVNNSPTKNTREMSTTVNMHDGEVIVLGGLVQDDESRAATSVGWLPRFLDGRSGSKGRTEVLLVLQVQRVSGDQS
ncbi:type II secretory pathway protein [Burkholderia anthina]|uniref:type II secretion system protein GspD n=1 Tax=Burkholderia anthina TaxID=179879 RepID=UPI001CF58B38|nr:type II secretory pathway protein [Burkholderia anthina]MCA8094471.1 type II secretory pathway protein [Burkholderia anthina]